MRKLLFTDVFNMFNRGELLQVDALVSHLDYSFGLLSLYGFVDKHYCAKNNVAVLGFRELPSFFKLFPFLFVLYLRAWFYSKTGKQFFLNGLLREIKGYDLAADLGGETFTTNSNLFYAFKHIYTLKLLNCLNVPYAILSQTIFLGEGLTRKFSHQVLSKALFVSARDYVSYRLMVDLNVESSFMFPDVAFAGSKLINPVWGESLRVGVNVSPFVESNLCEYVEVVQDLVDLGYQVLLIPHVTFDKSRDDRRVLRKLYGLIKPSYRGSIVCVFGDDFNLIRDAIDSCNIIVGSRMHMIIYSLSVGIPCVLTSYSDKSVSLKSQFKDGLFLVSKDDFRLSSRIVECVMLIDDDYVNIVEKLGVEIKLIKKEAEKHISLLHESVL